MNMKLIARTRAAFFKLCGKHAPLSFRRARQGFQRNSRAKTQAAARVDAFRSFLYDESAGRLAQLVRAPALQAGGRRFEPCTAHHPCAPPFRGDVVQLVRTLPCRWEFWNACTRPIDRNGYALPLKKQTGGRNSLKKSFNCFPTAWRCMKSGGNYLSRMGCLAFRSRCTAGRRDASIGVKRILTFNDRDFSRYRDIEAVQPINSFVDKGCSPGATPSSFELGPFGCRIIRRLRSCPRNLSAKLRLALGCECGCFSVPTGSEPSNISNNWLGVLCSRSR